MFNRLFMFMSEAFKILLILLIIVTYSGLKAQDGFIAKWHPDFSVSRDINDTWAGEFSLSGLYALADLNAEDTALPAPERIDGKLSLAYSMGKATLSAAYMYRIYGPYNKRGFEHRITEQFAYKTKLAQVGVAHRVRLEQRIFDIGYQNRLRYRLGFKFPIKSGGEASRAYWILTDEGILSFNSEKYGLENRFEAGIGWQFTDDFKFDFKLQHRFKGGENDQALHIVTNFSYDF